MLICDVVKFEKGVRLLERLEQRADADELLLAGDSRKV